MNLQGPGFTEGWPAQRNETSEGSGFAGDLNSFPLTGIRYLNEGPDVLFGGHANTRIRCMSAAVCSLLIARKGQEIGNHSMTHPDFEQHRWPDTLTYSLTFISRQAAHPPVSGVPLAEDFHATLPVSMVRMT